ncbi:MAG: flavin reductase family protein [Granulosicoccus sp.]|nr:flavin reductase family protein [Granulosicoccus sp.]
MHFPLSDLSVPQTYALLTQSIIPRPVAWVLSENEDQSFNLAPFSYFNALASDPPLLIISIGRKDAETEKDTRVNIRERKDFVVHIAHRELAWAMTQTAATLPAGQSELEGLDLTLAQMPGSRLPRIGDCRLAFACCVSDIQTVGTQELVFAEVSDIYVDDEVMGADAKGRPKILADKVDPIARLGGGEYVSFGEIITIERPA